MGKLTKFFGYFFSLMFGMLGYYILDGYKISPVVIICCAVLFIASFEIFKKIQEE